MNEDEKKELIERLRKSQRWGFGLSGRMARIFFWLCLVLFIISLTVGLTTSYLKESLIGVVFFGVFSILEYQLSKEAKESESRS